MTGSSDHDGLYIPGSSHRQQQRGRRCAAPRKATRGPTCRGARSSAPSASSSPRMRCCTLLLAAVRIFVWVAIAGFMAVVLAPLVGRLHHRLGGRRTLATGTVVFGTLHRARRRDRPVHHAGQDAARQHHHRPSRHRARCRRRQGAGRQHRPQAAHRELRAGQRGASSPAPRTGSATPGSKPPRRSLSAAFAFITIILLTFLFLSQSAAIGRAAENLDPVSTTGVGATHRRRCRRRSQRLRHRQPHHQPDRRRRRVRLPGRARRAEPGRAGAVGCRSPTSSHWSAQRWAPRSA